MYGKDWKRIQKHVGTRSATQARSHAQKYFRRLRRTKNVEALETQEATPLCSPVCNPISMKENVDVEKPKKRSKRTLHYEEGEERETTTKRFTANAPLTENSKLYEEFQEEIINIQKQEVCLDIEPLVFPQNTLIMGPSYDPYMYASWEKELDIENFRKRLVSSPFFEGVSVKMDKEEPREEYIEHYNRCRTLSSMFE